MELAHKSNKMLDRLTILMLLFVVHSLISPVLSQQTTTTASSATQSTTTSSALVGTWNIGGSIGNTTSMYQSVNLSSGILSVTVGPFAVTTTKVSTAGSTSSGQGTFVGAVLPPLNVACIVLQLYVCLFGRRMRMNGLRWFTLYYNLWNIYQVVVSDTADSSPWKGWLGDSRFTQNAASLELLTMSVFPIGVVLLIPLALLSHFCFCCALRWLPWLLLFVLLTIAPSLIYNGGLIFSLPVVVGNASIAVGNTTSVDLFQGYAFVSISLAIVSALYLVPLMLVALCFFLCYRLFNRYNPISNHTNRASRMVDLILLAPFLLIVLAFHMPCFVVNLSGFFIANVYPTLSAKLLPLLTASSAAGGNSTASGTSSPLGGGNSMSMMMDMLNYYNQIVLYKDTTELALPLVEFLASFLFIRMFREQYLALISCYACYKGDKDGACGVCCCGGGGGKGRRWGRRQKRVKGIMPGGGGALVGQMPVGPTAIGQVPMPAAIVVQPPSQLQQGQPVRWAQPVARSF